MAGSTIVGHLAARPRLVATLVVVTLAVAMQGTVAAEDCTYCTGQTDGGSADTGP